jgi:PTH1 family peptidyl-tRNA hydrolase
VSVSAIVVGLGNPGEEYAATRHNVGQMVVEELARRCGVTLKSHRKTHTRAATGQLSGQPVMLAVPMSYMNLSGGPVASLAKYQSVAPEDLIVVHDELDIPFGTVRLKRGGGSAGHNGLKDIQAQLGTGDYWRLRLGIGHPGVRAEVIDYVLRKPAPEQREAIEKCIELSLGALDLVLDGNMERAMMKIHAKPPRPKPAPKPSSGSQDPAEAMP